MEQHEIKITKNELQEEGKKKHNIDDNYVNEEKVLNTQTLHPHRRTLTHAHAVKNISS